MDRYERITALHRLLKSARYPVTVATLQDKLGCSRATVYRDLAFLRDALMAPIEGFGNQGGQSVNVVDVAQTAALGDALRAGDIQPYVDQFGTEYAQ